MDKLSGQRIEPGKIIQIRNMVLCRKSYLLLKAIERGENDLVFNLLNDGANPNFSPPHFKGVAALTFALNFGLSDKILNLLIEKGADPLMEDQKGMCPVRIGLRYGRLEFVNSIKNTFPLELGFFKPQDEFWCSVFLGERVEALELFKKFVVNFDRLDDHGHQLFSFAARFGNAPAVNLLVELGFPLDLTDDDAMTPLHWAAWRADVNMVKLLTGKCGSPLNNVCHFGVTPLEIAIYGHENLPENAEGYKAVIQVLMDAGSYVSPERKMSLKKGSFSLGLSNSIFWVDNLPPPPPTFLYI